MIWLCLLVALGSLLLGLLYRRLALRWDIVDVPNARSAHDRVVPSGGGLALILSFAAGYVGLLYSSENGGGLLTNIFVLGLLLMLVGVIDDRRNLGVGIRLFCYGLCCLLASRYLLPGQPWWWSLATALGLLWLLNLYNFMDGIDGIAGAETVFVTVSAAALGWYEGVDRMLVDICLLLASACLGFLVLNWPRASLFLGDAGSVPLGFLLGVISLQFVLEDWRWLVCWLILLAVFVVDTTTTLLWRMWRGEHFMEAHNLHAYQRLSRHWNSHSRVLALMAAINLLWLLPLAYLSLQHPQYAPWALPLAYLPLFVGVLKTYKLP
jgi:Fuc2NAc and GlcNAc transferase